MDEQQIYDNINWYQSRIDNNNNQIWNLRNRYEELEQIRLKLYESQSKLNEQRQNVRNKAGNIQCTFTKVRFMQLFSDVLKQSADDSYAIKAEEGICNSIEEVNQKMNSILSEISSLESDNSYCSTMIDDYYYQLNTIQQEED